MDTENKDEVEPALIPSDLQPSPPSKSVSVHSGEQDNEKKYETIQTIKMTEIKTPKPLNKSLEKTASVLASSLNLLPTVETQHHPQILRGFSVNTKLGIIQLVLSLLLSAFGGLVIARNSHLAYLGSGVWAGILAGITGSLGLMNIKQLINGFLACSLVCVASSTLALALTGIGLVRDYNLSQQNQEFEGAVFASCGLTFLLILHLFTSMFSVYYSALELCSNKDVYTENMNYEKFQNINKYLKSLQNAGVTNCDLNGYQNYINNAKLYRQRSAHHHHPSLPHNVHPYQIQPIYAPVSAVSSSYMTNPRLYTLPHSYQSNFYQDYCYNETTRSPGKSPRERRHKKPAPDDSSKVNMNYMGEDRDIAESYLKSIEAKESQNK